ncbi:MAG: glycosyltransferase family 2 protein [Nitrospinales bacterium]
MIDGKNNPEFSVIITCYYEERSIEEFYTRLSKALESCGRSFEIVMVNDGSTDGTFKKLKDIYDRDLNVTTIIDLFRNSGQLAAMTAGISHAQGEHFVFIDSDLQLEPEELPNLIQGFDKGCDIVSGCRKDRKDPLARKISSKLANLIVKKVSGHTITDFGCTFKIYNGKLIRAFELGPHKLFQTAYIYSRARKVKEVPITHHARKYGKSGWTFKKLFSFHMDNVVGISRRPFQGLSVICMLCAVLFFLRVVLSWILPFSVLKEITPGLILNVQVFALLLLLAVLAVAGEYVIRNFIVLQKYPIYIIREIHEKCNKDD